MYKQLTKTAQRLRNPKRKKLTSSTNADKSIIGPGSNRPVNHYSVLCESPDGSAFAFVLDQKSQPLLVYGKLCGTDRSHIIVNRIYSRGYQQLTDLPDDIVEQEVARALASREKSLQNAQQPSTAAHSIPVPLEPTERVCPLPEPTSATAARKSRERSIKDPDQEGENSPSKETANLHPDSDLASLSLRELYDLAKGIHGVPDRQATSETRRYRSAVVKAFAKSWARGFCQFCGNIAQYEDAEGRPRLHVHHIQYLDQGGQDAVENVVAICPNCHDIIHLRQARADADILRAAVTNQLLNFA